MSVFVVRAFVRLRESISTYKELTDKISELEDRMGNHDVSINTIILTIKQLMAIPKKTPKQIGFQQIDRALTATWQSEIDDLK
jgi:hypothetical protein